jgi:hypothetical protein
MRVVHHLLSDTEWHFDDLTTPEHALAQVYCEEQNLSSWYYNHCPHFEKAHEELPFSYGKQFVGLGDFATRREA